MPMSADFSSSSSSAGGPNRTSCAGKAWPGKVSGWVCLAVVRHGGGVSDEVNGGVGLCEVSGSGMRGENGAIRGNVVG